MSLMWLHIMFFFLFPESQLEKQWLRWKDKTFEKELTSEISFLNAISLEQARSGESLYLKIDPLTKQTVWSKKSDKTFFAKAEHVGEKIRITVQDKTLGYLTQDSKNRRRQFNLPNGLIAEVVFASRANKMWTYLYDPKQIKKFTGFRFYPFNEKAIVKAVFTKTPTKKVGHKTVQGDLTEVNKVGNVSFIINDTEVHLSAYSWQKNGELLESISLIFVDETAGKETYGGGRELTVELKEPLASNELIELNFNQTINFYCAHSPFWHCPVGLQEPIKTKVMAGEMLPLRKIVPQIK